MRSCAVVVPRGQPPEPAELLAFRRVRGLAAYKVPDRFELVDAFPATGVGKVSKRELRRGLESGAEGSRTKASPGPLPWAPGGERDAAAGW